LSAATLVPVRNAVDPNVAARSVTVPIAEILIVAIQSAKARSVAIRF
jgi:hypothetical protein